MATALGAVPAGGGGGAPGALGRARGPAQAQRPVADGALGRGAAAVAGQPGRVARPRRLHQHRPVLDGLAQQGERLAGQPGRPCPGVAGEVVVGVAGQAHRDAGPDDVAGGHDLGGPVGADEVLRLDAAGVGRQQGGGAGLLGAHEQDLAGVGVRRPRLVVQVVAVVPDRDQAEVVHRCERGGPGADDDAHRPAADRQEGAVALGRTRVRGEHDVPALAETLGQGGVETVDVAVVGHADEGAPAGRRGRGHRLGQEVGPVVAGHDGPDGAGRLPRGQGRQERLRSRVVRGELRPGLRARPVVPALRGVPSRRSRAAGGRRAGARRTWCRRTSWRRHR